jgi:F-type H+-transporting ATPase subunit b
MPQLNPADFAPQLIWLAITFIALYWVLAKIALPRVGEVLQLREDKIRGDLDRAAALKGESDKALAAYEQALAEARAKAQELARTSDAAIAKETGERQTALAAELAGRLRDAESRIAAAKSVAMGNVSTLAAEAARLAVERVAGLSVSQQEAESAARAVGLAR